MTDWRFPKAAPNFIPLRVKVRCPRTNGEWGDGEQLRNRELPYLLVRDDDRWFYSRTMVPVYPWHKPVLWTDTPRNTDELLTFGRELELLWGAASLSGRAVHA